jgi:hypothetical protein
MGNISRYIPESTKANGINVPIAIPIRVIMQFTPAPHRATHSLRPMASIPGLLAINI